MRLWITRTEPGAHRLAQAVAAIGVTPVELPLLRIEPLTVSPPGRFFDAVVVLSAHAAAALPALRLDAGRWFAVGKQTAKRTAEVSRSVLSLPGSEVISPLDERSEGLLPLLRPIALSGGRIALVAGQGGREWLADQLTLLGAEVVRLAVYRRVPNTELAPPPCDVIEIASEAALGSLIELCGVVRQPLLVASERLHAQASSFGLQNVHNAGGADADALVAVLRDLLES